MYYLYPGCVDNIADIICVNSNLFVCYHISAAVGSVTIDFNFQFSVIPSTTHVAASMHNFPLDSLICADQFTDFLDCMQRDGHLMFVLLTHQVCTKFPSY